MARFGISKTTVEDVAREARLSRATLYRVFPGGRDEIMASMVTAEIDSYFAGVAARLDGVDDIEERIVVAMTSAAEGLVRNRALGFLLAHEPAVVLPHISFAKFDRVLEITSGFFAPYLAGLLDPEDARRVGEWVTRLVLSHVGCPATSLDDPPPTPDGEPFSFHPEPLSPERARWLVHTFVMPGIEVLTAASSSAGCQPTNHSPSATPA